MGIYFNPGNASYRGDVNSRIYVDKTGLLGVLNKKIGSAERCVAISHARRFGKSQAAGMIDAYYSKGSDSHELFADKEIAKSPDFETYLNKYNVIHLDVSSFTDSFTDNVVEKITEYLYDDFKEALPDIDYSKAVNSVLSQIFIKTGIPFVIIIDEWDCIIRNMADNQRLVHEYLQFLHTLFKSEESKSFLALGYITGILPIKKIKDESALNNFHEYTMLESDEMTPYFGFTEDEVRALCADYQMNFDTVKQWYDGYRISGIDMYNPNSVYEAMARHRMDSYWKNTSAFDTINTYITLNYDGLKDDVLKMLEGKKVRVDTYGFSNDLSEITSKDDALTALIHLGYLAYDGGKAYIPNYEVSVAYKLALRKSGWSEVAKSIALCDELLDETIEGNAKRVAEIIELSHEAYTSISEYNDENSLSCAITMAYFTAPAYYTVIRELPSGKGYADIAMIPRSDTRDMPPILVELKYNKDAESAIKQIHERRYTGALKAVDDEIIVVGVNYDPGSKEHECVIERVVL